MRDAMCLGWPQVVFAVVSFGSLVLTVNVVLLVRRSACADHALLPAILSIVLSLHPASEATL
jgi:hypothetical protein